MSRAPVTEGAWMGAVPLGDAVVQVFLDRVRPAGEAEHVLTEQERIRCARYHHQADRDRYVSLRALLREVLAGEGLEEAELVREAAGRPRLAMDSPQELPDISLAKSGSWVGVALLGAGHRPAGGCVPAGSLSGDPLSGDFGAELRVGLDMESLAAVDQPGFTGLVCTREEVRALERLPPGERPAEKLRLWTAKEALLKATGEGLLRDPRTVPAASAGTARLRHLPGVPQEGMGLSIALTPAAGGTPVLVAATTSEDTTSSGRER